MGELKTFLEAGKNKVLYDSDYFEVRSYFVLKFSELPEYFVGNETLEDCGHEYRQYYLQCVQCNKDGTVPQPKGMTSAECMFSGLDCAELDLNDWDMGNVISIAGMFSGCKRLVSLKADDWDLHNCLSMNSAFAGCKSLVSLNAAKWHVNKMQSAVNALDGCMSLKEFDLGECDLADAEIEYLFDDCISLDKKYKEPILKCRQTRSFEESCLNIQAFLENEAQYFVEEDK